jgi:hypothetical protein
MDQVVGQALATFRRIDAKRRKATPQLTKIWTEAAE